MTRRFLTAFIVAIAGLSFLAVGATPAGAAPKNCAFQDANDNGVFDAGDTIVNDADWLGKPFTSSVPFVVPVNCDFDFPVAPPPLFGLRVIAPKITILSSIVFHSPGGKGMVFIADPAQAGGPGDGSIHVGPAVFGGTTVQLKAGGADNFIPATVRAVFGRAVALWATGKCTYHNADIEGTVPTGFTEIGMLCGDDAEFRGVKVLGSRVNIQSINGTIDARSFAVGPPNNLGDLCDNPVTNLQGGNLAPGNGNGSPDAGDFPCTLDFTALAPLLGVKNFADQAALLAFCGVTPPGGQNQFLAANDPVIMISHKDLQLEGAPDGSGDTIISGRTRVTLASETGNVLVQNTQINHLPLPSFINPPNGAKIELVATPAGGIVFLPDDREDFLGPTASGTVNIDSACLKSHNKAVLINGTTVVGTPDPPPCFQFPADFTFVANIIH